MKLVFLGVGSAFCGPEQRQTNALLRDTRDNRSLLIDCGTDIRFSLKEQGVDISEIDAVYISHLHADHVGGLEWLALSTYFNSSLNRPKLFCNGNIMNQLWERVLYGGLAHTEGKVMHLTDYFECHALGCGDSFTWSKSVITPVKATHVNSGYQSMYSYGVVIDVNPKILPFMRRAYTPGGSITRIFYTADAKFDPAGFSKLYMDSDIIFHDCETSPNRTGVHAHYDDLKTLWSSAKQKMWLMHYQANPSQAERIVGSSDANPEAAYQVAVDGFAGFVQKGQTFDLETPDLQRY